MTADGLSPPLEYKFCYPRIPELLQDTWRRGRERGEGKMSVSIHGQRCFQTFFLIDHFQNLTGFDGPACCYISAIIPQLKKCKD